MIASIFDQFTKQPYLSKGGTTLKKKSTLHELNSAFVQYAWELDVEQQLIVHLKHSPMPVAATTSEEVSEPESDVMEAKGKGKGKIKKVKGKGKQLQASATSLTSPTILLTSGKKRKRE